MVTGLTLDSGALIAAEKGSRRFLILWEQALLHRTRVTLPAVVLAQVWRGNSPRIARLLPACLLEPFDEELAKDVGVFLARARRSDVVDAAVVLGAALRGDTILTSDPDDIAHLVGHVGGKVGIIPC